MISVLPSAPVSRVEALASNIEHVITARGLVPGERITTVAELRAQTGLAKQTITETLRLLADRGLVEIRPGRGGGAFVAAANPVVRLRQTLLAVPHGDVTVADAIAVREALEELICTDAARSRSSRDIADLRKHINRMRRATKSVQRFMAANWALHERIARIGPNEVARAVYLGTLGYVTEHAAAVSSMADQPGPYFEERTEIHAALVEAIAAGDLDRTAAAVTAHRGIMTKGHND